jgi:hypothetical protein
MTRWLLIQLNAGKVERVTMKAVSPLADFSYDYQDLLFPRRGRKPETPRLPDSRAATVMPGC